MLEIMYKGGPLMVVILLCSVIAVAVIIERFIRLRVAQINTERFMSEIKGVLEVSDVDKALRLCEETSGSVSGLCRTAILNVDREKDEIKEAIEDAARSEIPRLSRNLNLLSTIAHITPLLGLLGTVTGMIDAFQGLEEEALQGGFTVRMIAGGIWQALLTTAFGLSVAIVTYVAHSYLAGRLENLIVEMERSATDILNLLKERTG
mgnify:FL=1